MTTPALGATVKVSTPPLGGSGAGNAPSTASLAVGPSVIEGLARGAAQGATMKWGDEIQGAIQASLPMPGDPATWGERYDRQVGAARADDNKAREAHPVAYHGADFAASLPAAIATGGAGSTAGRVAMAGGAGLVQGGGAGEGLEGKLMAAGFAGPLAALGQYGLGELLFPWLAGKLGERADSLLLQKLGVTRKQYRDMQKQLTPEQYETTTADMADMVRSGRVANAPGANMNERAANATAEAGQDVRGFYQQADQAAPWSPGLTRSTLSDMESAITRGGKPMSAGGEAASHRAQQEVDQLGRHITEGRLGHENAHDVLLDIGEHAFPNGQPAANVSQHQFARMTQTGKEGLRANARANQPPGGGPVTPEAFDSSTADYSKLLDIRKAAQASAARDDSRPGLYAAVRNYSPLILGALGVGGSAAAHGGSLTPGAAGLGLAVAAGTAAAQSPAINHLGAQFLGSQAPGAIGRAAFSPTSEVVGQSKAAKDFASRILNALYTPPTPAAKGK